MNAGRKQANRNAVAVAPGQASTAAPAGVCATRVALPKAECLDRMSGPRKQAVALVVRFDSEYLTIATQLDTRGACGGHKSN
jgi:hypothetical protein